MQKKHERGQSSTEPEHRDAARSALQDKHALDTTKKRAGSTKRTWHAPESHWGSDTQRRLPPQQRASACRHVAMGSSRERDKEARGARKATRRHRSGCCARNAEAILSPMRGGQFLKPFSGHEKGPKSVNPNRWGFTLVRSLFPSGKWTSNCGRVLAALDACRCARWRTQVQRESKRSAA